MWEKECISKPFFVFQLSPPGVMLCIHRTLPEVINQGTVERMHAGRNTGKHWSQVCFRESQEDLVVCVQFFLLFLYLI